MSKIQATPQKSAAAEPNSRDVGDANFFLNLRDELKTMKTEKPGENLMTHLNKVFKEIILHEPDKGLKRFEEISYLIKHDKDLNEFLKLEDSRCYTALAKDLTAYQEKVKKLCFEQVEEDEEGNIPQSEPIASEVPDLMADTRIYAWAGIGFGEQETYRLQKSLKAFTSSKPYKSVRFFGKIHGTEKDYYVIECEGEVEDDGEEEAAADGDDDAEEGEADAKLEAKGTGVNELTYYVTHDSLSNWTKLPTLSYNDINAARRIKVLFTGNLDRKIYTNPFFFGQEKHYLRAQIARISHSTTLFPKGLMRLVEDDETKRSIERNDPEEGELKLPATKDMVNPSMWVHAKPNILCNGRTTHLDPEEPAEMPEGEEFDPEEAKKQIEKNDPFEPRLKPVTEDNTIAVTSSLKMAAWSVRIFGDTTEYRDERNPAQTVSNAVVVVRSMLWPGAFSLYCSGRVFQIYLGNGHKAGQTNNIFPVDPPTVMADEEEYEEQPEPNPLQKEGEAVSFTDLWLELAKKCFEEMEQDDDNAISCEELDTIMKKLGAHLTPDELKNLLQSCDKDQDGTLNYDEFLTLFGKYKGMLEKADILMMHFRNLDTDNSGKLSADEIREAFKFEGELFCTEENIQSFIETMDEDEDGKIDIKEFISNNPNF